MSGRLLSQDMYKVLARYAILGHDYLRVCVSIVCMACTATQVLYVSSLKIYIASLSAYCTLSSLIHPTATRIAGRRHRTCDLRCTSECHCSTTPETTRSSELLLIRNGVSTMVEFPFVYRSPRLIAVLLSSGFTSTCARSRISCTH